MIDFPGISSVVVETLQCLCKRSSRLNSIMWSLKQLADVIERSVLNVVDGCDASTELLGNVDIRQSMFLKYRDEDVRVASFVDWPHKNPSPKELAKFGFFSHPFA